MIKFMPVWKPRPGRTRGECLDHFRYEHSRLACSVPEFHRHMNKYVQNFVLDDLQAQGGFSTTWAGIAENWFYSLEGFFDAFAEPGYAVFREDEKRFVDMDDLLLVAANPYFVFAPSNDRHFKLFRFGYFKQASNAVAARKFWETTYAAAVAMEHSLRTVARAYVQNRRVEFAHTFPVARSCDTVDEFWLDSLDGVPELLRIEQDIRDRVGYDKIMQVSSQISVVTEAKVLWDLGEDPKVGLSRIRR
jgi:hypothetical protein